MYFIVSDEKRASTAIYLGVLKTLEHREDLIHLPIRKKS